MYKYDAILRAVQFIDHGSLAGLFGLSIFRQINICRNKERRMVERDGILSNLSTQF